MKLFSLEHYRRQAINFWGSERKAKSLGPTCMTSFGIASLKELKAAVYCSHTRRWFLLGMRQMRMRKISYRMTSCYYASWKHSHSALAYCTLLEMLDAFSLYSYVTAEQSVAPTDSSPVVTHIGSSPPHRARHVPHPRPRESSRGLWSVVIRMLWYPNFGPDIRISVVFPSHSKNGPLLLLFHIRFTIQIILPFSISFNVTNFQITGDL
jgi:hypothetical protein